MSERKFWVQEMARQKNYSFFQTSFSVVEQSVANLVPFDWSTLLGEPLANKHSLFNLGGGGLEDNTFPREDHRENVPNMFVYLKTNRKKPWDT
jgi:hypothetical protein